MPSKGTRVYSFRIREQLMREISLAIERRNVYSRDEPWTLTGFVLAALEEKLSKMERSRGGKRRGGLPEIFPVTVDPNT